MKKFYQDNVWEKKPDTRSKMLSPLHKVVDNPVGIVITPALGSVWEGPRGTSRPLLIFTMLCSM